MAFEGLSDRLAGVFKRLRGRGRLKENDVKEVMREIRLALLEADVNYKVAKDFIAKVTERAVGSEVLESLTPAQQIIKIVNEELTELMGGENARVRFSSKLPTILMLCGLQGSGKTTHAGKLAKHFRSQGKRPMLAACDVYRPAAIKQLQVVGEQVGVPVFELGQGDPVQIAKKAVAYARDYGHDPLILDTAGRLHIDEALMAELASIRDTVHPHEVLLVVDAMTGQDAVTVAESFQNAIGIDGVILTKLDGDTRGGAALSVRAVTGKPIKFAGTGEKLDALEPFYPARMASRILGMGDVVTLIEKATAAVDVQQAAKLEEKLKKNSFDLEDLLEQMKQIQGMGSFGQVLGMIPGVKVKDEQALAGEREIRKIEAMIHSMTPLERRRPELISPSRKRRIAAGSGTRVEDVNRLLRQFNQMQRMVKQMTAQQGKKRKGGIPGIPGMPGMRGLPF